MKGSLVKHLTGAIGLAALCAAATACSGSGTASTGGAPQNSTSIALSNSYAGNFWRQIMISTFQDAAKSGKAQGLVSSSSVVNADNTASDQISQLQSMIIQGWKGIVIDAASTTALNGVIQKACSRGIKVVVFDSLATAPCATDVTFDYVQYGKFEATWVAQHLNGHGNVLEIRGIAGTSVDNDIHQGIVEGLKQYPGIKVVGSVHGNWTKSITQQAVAGILPSLPKVDAVVDQGGDGSGAGLAFQAARRPLPLIVMGNRGDELRLWQQQLGKPLGNSMISISSEPGVASVALWVDYMLIKGEQVPKTVTMPLLTITKPQLSNWIGVTPPTGVATPVFTLGYTEQLVKANLAHTTPPSPPSPGQKSFIPVPGS
jgi:ribose transport system substrate-binding protein